MASVTVINKSNTKLLFSLFNKGDNAIPKDTKWINGENPGDLDAGGFNEVGIGVQAQEGGRWIGGDPKNPPYTNAGGTFTLTITKASS